MGLTGGRWPAIPNPGNFISSSASSFKFSAASVQALKLYRIGVTYIITKKLTGRVKRGRNYC
jgi:hypothetical protein